MSVLIIDWLTECCVKCGSKGAHEVDSYLGDHGELHRGDTVKCGGCGHGGVIEVYSNEEVCVAWSEYVRPIWPEDPRTK